MSNIAAFARSEIEFIAGDCMEETKQAIHDLICTLLEMSADLSKDSSHIDRWITETVDKADDIHPVLGAVAVLSDARMVAENLLKRLCEDLQMAAAIRSQIQKETKEKA